MTAKPIKITDESIPLRTRIRAVYQPGMTVTELARRTKADVAKVKKAVGALKASGFIKVDVPHEGRGEALRRDNAGPTVTAAMKASFRRAVPEDMAAQIAAFPKKKITKCPPGGQKTFFGQALSNRPYPSMEA
ncbi:hypothetical protein ACHMW5_13510 [Azospirillum melinis]|uniref:hypothetical protein n=1 Tax=Azospirillum melinis TaxID=328839 RepID=UPI0037563232